MNDMDEEPIPVFVSYSHKDERWLERLMVHLAPLEKLLQIDMWADTRIRPGSLWRDELRAGLSRAKIAILLVSADFLASEFIRTHELPPLLTSAELRGVAILPLIVSPCRFLRTQEISRFQAVNSPAATLLAVSPAEQELTFLKLAHAIEDRVHSERAATARSLNAGSRNTSESRSASASEIPNSIPPGDRAAPEEPDSGVLAWSVRPSKDHEPSPVTSVEDFIEEVTWAGLLKIGNWIRDEQGKRIIGADQKTYLLSQQNYGTEAFIIDTTLEFTNFKLPQDGKLGMNAGIMFGWQYEQAEPRYLNILLTGATVQIERCGYGYGRDVRDKNKLTQPVPLEIKSGEAVRFRITIDDAKVNVWANGRDLFSAPRPEGTVGRVGIRPWRSKVDITSFVVESI
jgi:hypothetical protein